MSKAKWGLKNPEKINFVLPPLLAEKFRKYCIENQYVMGKVIEYLVEEHLISEGIISKGELE